MTTAAPAVDDLPQRRRFNEPVWTAGRARAAAARVIVLDGAIYSPAWLRLVISRDTVEVDLPIRSAIAVMLWALASRRR